MKDSDSKNIKDLEARVKELESVLDSKQIMIDYLEKMMEIAKEELDIDIKNNFGTPQSTKNGQCYLGMDNETDN